MNEKQSYTEYNVIVPTQDFVITFEDYNASNRDTINVTVDGVPATTAGFTVQRISDTVIRLTPAVESGAIVRLQRETDIDNTFYRFTAGAIFTAGNVDKNFQQILHSQQEVRDTFEKLAGDVYPLVNGLEQALETASEAANAADAASEAAQIAAEAAEDAAGQSKYILNYYDPAWVALSNSYPPNAILMRTDGTTIMNVSGIALNNDPNSDMTGWKVLPSETIETVSYFSDLANLDTYTGKFAQVKSFDANTSVNGGGVYQFNGTSWIKISDNLTTFDFGAYTGADVGAQLESAAGTASKVELPINYTFSADNCNFDTSKFYGDGNLRFINHDRIMTSEYRKGVNEKGITTLEDEFGQHVDTNNRYSGFGCSAIVNGKEYVAVRCGQNHFYNPTVPSSVVMYVIDRNRNNVVTKQVLVTSTVGQDIRDINISLLPQFGNRLLIKYAVQTSASTYDTYLLVYNCTNDSVEYTRKVLLPSNQFTWGNSLITPSGFILIPSYGIDGSTVLYRSNAAYDYTQETDLAVTLAATFETSGSAEPTICYYDDQLIIFYRMGTGINGKFNKTYNLEGTSGWGASVSLSREVHAPYVDPYNFGKSELLMMCSLGNARSLLATFATQNLETWYSTARLLVAGNTTLASGQTGGYPSFVDYGENLSVQSYADFRSSDMTLTSRLDIRLVKKSMYSSLNSYEAQRYTIYNSTLAWGEYSLGTGAVTIDIAIGLKRSLSVTKARIRMTGVSANTYAEILNSAGTVVATSAVASINTTTFQDIEFTFPSTALTAGNYSVRIQRRDTANPIVFNWDTSSIVKKRVIKNKVIDILGLVSSNSATLWNNAGIHVDLF